MSLTDLIGSSVDTGNLGLDPSAFTIGSAPFAGISGLSGPVGNFATDFTGSFFGDPAMLGAGLSLSPQTMLGIPSGDVGSQLAGGAPQPQVPQVQQPSAPSTTDQSQRAVQPAQQPQQDPQTWFSPTSQGPVGPRWIQPTRQKPEQPDTTFEGRPVRTVPTRPRDVSPQITDPSGIPDTSGMPRGAGPPGFGPGGIGAGMPLGGLAGLVQRFLGGIGGMGGVATQGPYAGQPIGQIPWMSPEQVQQYRQTGQLPQPTVEQQLQALANQPNLPINPVTGHPYNPVRAGDRWQAAKVLQDNQANPPSPDAQVVHNPDGSLTANIPGRGRVTVSRQAPDGHQMSDAEAIQAYAKPVSATPVKDSGGGVNGPYPNRTLQGRVANIMATGGMSPNAIAGVFQNISDESSWIPGERSSHYDQPRFSRRDARAYSHGLYQEGGDEWPMYQRFLQGRDWRDPMLQTEFMMQHFRQRDPQAWAAMNNARTPGEAARIFVDRYLKPAPQYRYSRMARYGRGVPGLASYFGQAGGPTALTPRSPGFSASQTTPLGPAQTFRPSSSEV